MRVRRRCLIAIVLAALCGCQNNPFAQQPQGFAWQQQPQQQPYLAQMQELNRRVTQLDANNRDLHVQLAQSQQAAQHANEQVKLLQTQLTDTAKRLSEAQLARKDAEKRVEAVQASARHRGGATITANNSIKATLAPLDIPGVEVRQEDDVIRIELPADQLFRQGGVQLLPGGTQLVDTVVDAISRNYPRQMIGIEGHTDPPLSGATATTGHQLAAAQAYVVFEYIASRNRVPAGQLFVVSHGTNRPRFSNHSPDGRARNRRIELVIYPETAGAN